MKMWILFATLFSWSAQAMPAKSDLLKPRAYFQEVENNLLEALDLKLKTLRFTKAEFDLCGQKLVRQSQSLNYSCTLPISSTARVSKLQKVYDGSSREVAFGGSKRVVQLAISRDARTLTLSTSFDLSGIDLELSKFNDDFFPVYAKVAQLVISEALAQPIRFEVLESEDTPIERPSASESAPKTEKAPVAPSQLNHSNKKKISQFNFNN